MSEGAKLIRDLSVFTIFIAKELATLPAAINVDVNACCPGFCDTNMFVPKKKEMSWISR